MFKPGETLDPIIQNIRQEATSVVSDISTAKGRDEIRSRAHKLARTKTALDEMGKQLVSGLKDQTKAIDKERSRAWDAIEALQHEIRAPLTEWENAEKDRVAAHEDALAAIPEGPDYGTHEDAAELAQRLAYLENMPARDWQEFSARAAKTLVDEIVRTKTLHAAAVNREAEQAEQARLRKEEADRQQREREQRIADEAAAKAKREAEEKAQREADAQVARVKAEQEQAEQERQRLERERQKAEQEKAEAEARAKKAEEDRLAAIANAKREKVEADTRAKKAEEDRIAAEAKAEADRKAAAEKAEQDRRDAEEAAAKRERDRIAAEERQRQEEAAKREADKKHRARINGEAKTAFVVAGLSDDDARKAVKAIAKGLVPSVKISY